MSKRSQWCDVSKELRKYIIDRDKGCVNCGAKKPLTMAHIFLSRAKGGKGCKENIVALCNRCHYYILDNPIGKSNIEKSKEILAKCYQHLFNKENVVYNDNFLSNLRYKKEYDIIKPKVEKQQYRCSNCIYLGDIMLEFKLNYFFEKYKNASVISSPKFKEAFIKKEGEFELLNELLVMIQRYQIKKYGDLVTTGKNTYETKGNGKRFNMELTRERNRFGTKEERKRRKINEKWRIQ